MNEDEFKKFRKLLEETYLFPATYTHKFIGKASPAFFSAVLEFEARFVGLTKTGERKSAQGNHIALTYSFIAGSSDDIIELTRETQKIIDLLYIL